MLPSSAPHCCLWHRYYSYIIFQPAHLHPTYLPTDLPAHRLTCPPTHQPPAAQAKPWLLEVNHAPSFSCGSPLDTMVKLELLKNTMRLIHLQAYHKKKFKQEQQQQRQQRMQQTRGTQGPKLSLEERERCAR